MFKNLLPPEAPKPIDEWVYTRLRAKEQIEWAEWQTFRMNSWEQEALMPHLTNDALILLSKQFLDNCERIRRPAITYEDGIVGVILPILLQRLEHESKP